MKAVDLAIEQSKTLEAYAQEQLDALNKSVEGLITLDNSVLTVADAIRNLRDLLGEATTGSMNAILDLEGRLVDIANRPINVTVASGTASVSNGVQSTSQVYNANEANAVVENGLTVADEIAALREEMNAAMYAIAKNTSKTATQLIRWDGDGLPTERTWVNP